jgi:leader peptidase (prepilin peptidase)/N-methyltransferase
MLIAIALVLGLLIGAGAAYAAEIIMLRRAWQTPVCPYCQTPYAPVQGSAFLALVLRQFHCRHCGKPLRWPRLAGEVLLALTWALLVGVYGLTPRVGFAMVSVIPLVMVTVTDLEAKLIPNRIILPSGAALLVLATIFGVPLPFAVRGAWWHALAGGALGFVVFWILANLGLLLVGEGALGAGDVKLAAYVGLLVGFPLIIEAMILSFILGGVGGVFVLVVKRGNLHTAMPYGPYIVLGGIITLLWGLQIATWFLS